MNSNDLNSHTMEQCSIVHSMVVLVVHAGMVTLVVASGYEYLPYLVIVGGLCRIENLFARRSKSLLVYAILPCLSSPVPMSLLCAMCIQ
jgi:hypothetical protein